MTRNNLFFGAIIAAALLSVTVSSDNLAYASVTHEVELSAETTVNGQLAYTVTGYSSDGLDQMSKFTAFDGKPSIPGPTITIEQGDIVQIKTLPRFLYQFRQEYIHIQHARDLPRYLRSDGQVAGAFFDFTF